MNVAVSGVMRTLDLYRKVVNVFHLILIFALSVLFHGGGDELVAQNAAGWHFSCVISDVRCARISI